MSCRLVLGAMLLGAVSTAAIAAGPLSVATRIMAEQSVAAADGTTRTRLVAPGKIVPGDRVTVVVAYRNTGTQPIANLVLANPIPAGLAYRSPAAGSPPPDVSVDGRRFGSLADLAVGGGGVTRPAQPRDVTQVRWRLPAPVPAGGGGEMAFQAVVR